MKGIFLLCSLSVTFFFATAQHGHGSVVETAENNTQQITDSSLFLKETVYDFGKIPQGKPVHHNFEVLNQGIGPMKLVNVQASCGCTTPEWDKDKDIPAGGTSIIKVGYNAASEGQFTKYITITYNDAQTKQITIKGEVWKTPSASAPSNAAINDLKE